MNEHKEVTMRKKQMAVIALFTGLLFATMPLVWLVCGFLLPARYESSFLGELKVKCARLEQEQGKRIVLVGGSGVAFGYDSQMLADAFLEYGIVNFGMYAGLGSKVMLDLSEHKVREGDIVILSPEQHPQTLSTYFNAEAMWQSADGDFSMLSDIKRENWGQMAGCFVHFAQEKLRYVRSGTAPAPKGVYSRSAFDAFGDIRSDLCSRNRMPLGYDANTPVYYTEEVLEDAFVHYMNAYAKKLRKKGVTVWYRLCPVNALAVQGRVDPGAEAAAFYERLSEKLDFPVIGNPADSVMEPEWFYDTNFHLNACGKIVNTTQLIRDIKAMLGDSSHTKPALVSRPAMAFAGDGRSRMLEADRYRGNSKMEMVTVGEEIRQIQDYAFDGCTNLRAIVMEQEDPSACLVGQHLLDGTDAMIYVPDAALSSYRLNYFWFVYSDRIKGLSALKK